MFKKISPLPLQISSNSTINILMNFLDAPWLAIFTANDFFPAVFGSHPVIGIMASMEIIRVLFVIYVWTRCDILDKLQLSVKKLSNFH